MPSLEDIVLVSTGDFVSTYSEPRHAEQALQRLSAAGITFPVKYTSPFFKQLNWLAVLVYFKGSVSLITREKDGIDSSPLYSAYLFVEDRFGYEWVHKKLRPFFSFSPKSNRFGTGDFPESPGNLNRPLARILSCLGIPTPEEDLHIPSLPPFITDLELAMPKLENPNSRALASQLLFDVYEAFLYIKTTVASNFYWEFFLPAKADIDTALLFRDNVVGFLESLTPVVKFRKLGKKDIKEPRPRVRHLDGKEIVCYEPLFSLPPEGVLALISNYAAVLDLGDMLAIRPKLLDFYLKSRNSATSAELTHM